MLSLFAVIVLLVMFFVSLLQDVRKWARSGGRLCASVTGFEMFIYLCIQWVLLLLYCCKQTCFWFLFFQHNLNQVPPFTLDSVQLNFHKQIQVSLWTINNILLSGKVLKPVVDRCYKVSYSLVNGVRPWSAWILHFHACRRLCAVIWWNRYPNNQYILHWHWSMCVCVCVDL